LRQDVGVEASITFTEGFTLRVKAIRRAARRVVTGDGRGLVSRAGTGLLVDTAAGAGGRSGVAGLRWGPRPGALHAPGSVLADLAIMLADGGTRLRHLDVLRCQPALFGTVASVPTATRTIAALADTDVEATVAALDRARAAIRARAWQLGALPPRW
jgi:hypothetical protein